MSDQKFWDAALIKTWRTNSTILDAFLLFKALSNKRTYECDPPLKRLPPLGMPYKIHVRVFVHDRLPKINDRLWKQTPDKDVLLLRKLETSSYDTLRTAYNRDTSIDTASEDIKRNKSIITANDSFYKNRNSATDWKTVKGPVKIQRLR
jgi:hypothetical protein